MVLGCAISSLTIRSVTGPIRPIIHRLQAIAAGDLAAPIDVTRDDELGQIATAVQTLTKHLHDSLVEVTHTSTTVATAFQQLAATAEQLSARTQEQEDGISRS